MSSVSFREKLETRVQKVQSLLCVGLDPHVSQVRSNGDLEVMVNFIYNMALL